MFMKYLYNSLKMAAFFSSQPLVGRKKPNDDEVCKLLIISYFVVLCPPPRIAYPRFCPFLPFNRGPFTF